MKRTRLESKPRQQRKLVPVPPHALAEVFGGRSAVEPAGFITNGGYDTTD